MEAFSISALIGFYMNADGNSMSKCSLQEQGDDAVLRWAVLISLPRWIP